MKTGAGSTAFSVPAPNLWGARKGRGPDTARGVFLPPGSGGGSMSKAGPHLSPVPVSALLFSAVRFIRSPCPTQPQRSEAHEGGSVQLQREGHRT